MRWPKIDLSWMRYDGETIRCGVTADRANEAAPFALIFFVHLWSRIAALILWWEPVDLQPAIAPEES